MLVNSQHPLKIITVMRAEEGQILPCPSLCLLQEARVFLQTPWNSRKTSSTHFSETDERTRHPNIHVTHPSHLPYVWCYSFKEHRRRSYSSFLNSSQFLFIQTFIIILSLYCCIQTAARKAVEISPSVITRKNTSIRASTHNTEEMMTESSFLCELMQNATFD